MSQLIKIAGWSRSSVHVIFVHGLDGHVYDTWRCAPDESQTWARWLAEDVPGLAAYSVAYDAPSTNWLGTSMALAQRATNVLERLLVAPELTHQPIIFICHSLGGLIVKQMLLDLKEQEHRRPQARSFLERVRGVVFISTPHTGSDKATWLVRLRLLAWPSPLTQSLMANDPEVLKLNVSYRGLADDLRARLENLVFYETQATAGGVIVRAGSSDPGLPGPPAIPIDADHVSICKPRDRSSLIYLRCQRFVEALADGQSGDDGTLETPPLPKVVSTRSRWPVVHKLGRLALLAAIVSVSMVVFSRPSAEVGDGRPSQPISTRLAGEIVDSRTKEPIAGVLVLLPELALEQRTGPNGRFEFVVPLPVRSWVRLRARRDGYRSLDEDLQIGGTHVDVWYLERDRPGS